MAETLTKQRKEINLNFDDPQLNLEDIARGAIIVTGSINKELVTASAYKREDASHWIYFETLERRKGKIFKNTYIGHAVDQKVYGIHIHEVISYKEPLLKGRDRNEDRYYELFDEKLKEEEL